MSTKHETMPQMQSGANGAVGRNRITIADILDSPGELRWVSKETLRIDLRYQRQAGEYKVREIARKWSWVACGVIVVANRRGIYYVIDGGHRVLAAIQRDDVKALPCIVFRTRSIEDEAGGYIAANKLRRPVTAIQTFRAMCIMGDPVAIGVRTLLDEHGIGIRHDSKSPKTIKCIGALLHCYKTDPGVFRDIWPLIVEVCAAGSIKQRVVYTLFSIECRLKGTASSLLIQPWRARVVSLSATGICDAAAKASALYAEGGIAIWTRGVVEAINRGIRNREKRLNVNFDRDESRSH